MTARDLDAIRARWDTTEGHVDPLLHALLARDSRSTAQMLAARAGLMDSAEARSSGEAIDHAARVVRGDLAALLAEVDRLTAAAAQWDRVTALAVAGEPKYTIGRTVYEMVQATHPGAAPLGTEGRVQSA